MRAHSLTLPPVDLAALIGAVDPFTVLVIRHAKDYLATAASAPPHVYFDPWDDPHRLAVARGQPLRRTLSAHQHERRAVHADAEGLVVSAEPPPHTWHTPFRSCAMHRGGAVFPRSLPSPASEPLPDQTPFPYSSPVTVVQRARLRDGNTCNTSSQEKGRDSFEDPGLEAPYHRTKLYCDSPAGRPAPTSPKGLYTAGFPLMALGR
jgi:hypothetical protein